MPRPWTLLDPSKWQPQVLMFLTRYCISVWRASKYYFFLLYFTSHWLSHSVAVGISALFPWFREQALKKAPCSQLASQHQLGARGFQCHLNSVSFSRRVEHAPHFQIRHNKSQWINAMFHIHPGIRCWNVLCMEHCRTDVQPYMIDQQLRPYHQQQNLCRICYHHMWVLAHLIPPHVDSQDQ